MTLQPRRAKKLLLIPLLLALAGASGAVKPEPPCRDCATWNMPQEPFRIFGNAYYVGPHGLSVILITSPRGHVLIDGALAESAPRIIAHIRELGFRPADIKLIVNSHVHFDHAGGISELQKLTGARVAASEWTADVLRKGAVSRTDPQFGVIRATPRVQRVSTLSDGQVFHVGDIVLTAHLTPGHTPGGTSWTWKSCDAGRCADMVYADSLTAVSADGFRFSDNRAYPAVARDFEKSFAFLRSARCDILLTPHPDFSALWERMAKRKEGVTPDPIFTPGGCAQLADGAAAQLAKRLDSERQAQRPH